MLDPIPTRADVVLRRGFTLIELLVVVGIIGVLMSLLLPTLASARNSMRQTACQANQHSIGSAILNYASDNDNTLVYTLDYAQSVSPFAGHRWSWDDFLDPYLGGVLSAADLDSAYPTGASKKVLIDPADTTLGQVRVDVNGTIPQPNASVRSYAQTRVHDVYFAGHNGTPGMTVGTATISGLFGWGSAFHWLVRDSSPSAAWTDGVAQISLPYRPYRLNGEDFPRPGSTIVITDYFNTQNLQGCPFSTNIFNQAPPTPNAHPGGFNYLYADGHVETKAYKATIGLGSLNSPLGEWNRL